MLRAMSMACAKCQVHFRSDERGERPRNAVGVAPHTDVVFMAYLESIARRARSNILKYFLSPKSEEVLCIGLCGLYSTLYGYELLDF